MARRRKTTRRHYSASLPKRSRSRYRTRSNPGTWMSILGGLATGFGNAFFNKQLGVWNLAVPAAIVAAFTHSEALETIAGFEAGRNITNLVTSPTPGKKIVGFADIGSGAMVTSGQYNMLG